MLASQRLTAQLLQAQHRAAAGTGLSQRHRGAAVGRGLQRPTRPSRVTQSTGWHPGGFGYLHTRPPHSLSVQPVPAPPHPNPFEFSLPRLPSHPSPLVLPLATTEQTLSPSSFQGPSGVCRARCDLPPASSLG